MVVHLLHVKRAEVTKIATLTLRASSLAYIAQLMVDSSSRTRRLFIASSPVTDFYVVRPPQRFGASFLTW